MEETFIKAFTGRKPDHNEEQSAAVFCFKWENLLRGSFARARVKKLSNLHLGKNLNRVDPEAVTEEDPDTALYCAWQNDHVATMGVLAEVVDASKEMRKVATFSLDSFFKS